MSGRLFISLSSVLESNGIRVRVHFIVVSGWSASGDIDGNIDGNIDGESSELIVYGVMAYAKAVAAGMRYVLACLGNTGGKAGE